MRRPSARPALALVVAAGLAVALPATTARGQATPGDASSLARYVPRDNLVFYFEYDGLDAHADAWRKTAAYKILNTTPAGAMLEDLFVQLVAKIPGKNYNGPENLAIVKHVARSGFVIAAGGDFNKDKPDYVVVAFRDAFKNKEVRPFFARTLQALNAPNSRPQAVVRVGHKVITGTNPAGATYSWWVEESKKEDLVLVLPAPESADIILETLEGKRPNAVDHPARAELARAEGGFQPTGLMLVDPVVFRSPKIPAALGLSKITKLDYRWGFQDDALMTVARIASPAPRTGLLGLLDGPSFEKGSLPPLPESLTGFTVTSLDLKASLDRMVALAKSFRPDAEDQVNKVVDALKAKTKLRLREDVLSHLGPRVAWYVLPARPGPAAAPAAPSMMGMMMSGVGLDQVPRLAIVFDVDDSAAFGKVLDELMAFANREIKAQMARQAGGDAAPGRGSRNRGAGPPTFEFRMMPGETKSYVLSVPPEMANLIPSTLRPTFRLGPKQLAIAVSSDLARQALEAKGTWTPPTELAGAFSNLSRPLKVLSIDDPRDTTPATLAALPAKLQAAINTAILKAQPPGTTPPGAGGPPGGPPLIAPPGLTPGGSPPPPAPGAPGQPGMAQPAGPSMVVLQVDAAKLPSAESIKALLFPSVTSVELNDEGYRVVVRQAFPDLGDPAQSGLMSSILNGARGRPPGPPPGMAPGPAAGPPPGGPAAPGNAAPGNAASGNPPAKGSKFGADGKFKGMTPP